MATSAIAERLGVSPASASAMLKRLRAMGLVDHRPYRGTELTEAGQRVALAVIRHHRLLELYLAEALGMPWDRVHAEAEVLEHAISPELSELIAEKLGNPTHDPHGDPIPSVDGLIEEVSTVRLADHGRGPGRRVHARVGLRPRDAALPVPARHRARRPPRGAGAPALRRPADRAPGLG